MLKSMSGMTIEDITRNEYMRCSTGVSSIVDIMRENKLKSLAIAKTRGNKNSKSGYENER
jgi:hypothetical protein